VYSTLPDFTSHTMTDLSEEQLAICVPVLLKQKL
jgi:hypothetical protein